MEFCRGTPATEWKVQDKPAPKVDGRELVTGKHRYPSDQKLPGMQYGRVPQPPSFGSTLGSVDTHEAEQISRVTVVHDGNFIGVAAPSEELASRAVKAIRAEWKSELQISCRELFEYLRKNPVGGRSRDNEVGSVEKGLAAADHRLEQTYTVAYIAHALLEPRAGGKTVIPP
jgi:isoquinoline 1-oxidoreductase